MESSPWHFSSNWPEIKPCWPETPMNSRVIVVAISLWSIWGHLSSPQSKDTTTTEILVLTTLTVTECNVKRRDTIRLREPSLQTVWQSCYLLSRVFQLPRDVSLKRESMATVINLELKQLNHFVWWNYAIMHINAPKRNPTFVVTKMAWKWE